MPRTPRTTSTTTRESPEATAVARDVIASLDHDPEHYVPGTLVALPGSRTVTWQTACSTRCPHPDRRCHRSHAAWVNDDSTHAVLAGEHVPAVDEPEVGVRVPAQRPQP